MSYENNTNADENDSSIQQVESIFYLTFKGMRVHLEKKTTGRWLLTITLLLSVFYSSGTPACRTSGKSPLANTELLVRTNFERKGTVSYHQFTSVGHHENPIDIFLPHDFTLFIRFQNQHTAAVLYFIKERVNVTPYFPHKKKPAAPEDSLLIVKG